MEIKKKMHVLHEDEESDWLQIWMVASMLDVTGNSKKNDFCFSC